MAQALKIQQEQVVSQFSGQSSGESEEDVSNSPMLSQALDFVFDADDRGIRLQIEINGEPSSYDYIMKLRDGVRSFGLSTQLADELIDVIDSEMTNTTADAAINEGFSQVKTVSLMVAKTPPAIDDDKFTFMRAWDRNKKHGAGYSSQQMHLTNRGTKTTTTNMPDLENLFTGNGERYLILCIEAFKADGLDGLDEVGMGLAELAVAAGPGVPAADLKEIRTAIEQKKIAPEQTSLIKNLADLNRVVETVARSPEAASSAPQAIKTAREAVSQTLQAVTTSGTLSPAILDSTIKSFQKSEAVIAPQRAQVQAAPVALKADNNNFLSVTAVKTHAAPQMKIAEAATKVNMPVAKAPETRRDAPVVREAAMAKPQTYTAPVVQKVAAVNKVQAATAPQVKAVEAIKQAPVKAEVKPSTVKQPAPVIQAKNVAAPVAPKQQQPVKVQQKAPQQPPKQQQVLPKPQPVKPPVKAGPIVAKPAAFVPPKPINKPPVPVGGPPQPQPALPPRPLEVGKVPDPERRPDPRDEPKPHEDRDRDRFERPRDDVIVKRQPVPDPVVWTPPLSPPVPSNDRIITPTLPDPVSPPIPSLGGGGAGSDSVLGAPFKKACGGGGCGTCGGCSVAGASSGPAPRVF